MRLKRLLRVLAVALVLGTVAPGVALGLSQAVTILSFAFTPPSVTINAGESVTWTNRDPVSHTATSNTGAFNTGPFGTGTSKTVTFAIAGTYAYHCSIHPSMTGTVTVLGPAPTPVPSTPLPTVAPTPPPTVAPTPEPTAAPASPSASPSESASATPSPTVVPSPSRSSITVPSASAGPSRSAGPTGPDLGNGPGTLLAIAGIVVAVVLTGLATLLYRRR